MGNRFPDVDWFCDRCDAHLNSQIDFDDGPDGRSSDLLVKDLA